MMTIKQIVTRLIKLYRTNDPYEIAAQKDIQVLFEKLGNILGYFNYYKRIPMIHINCGLEEPKQRFVCAHELGHRILHPNVNTPFLRENTFMSIDRIEREANEFAVELLIPDEALFQMSIYEAAATYGVPEEVAHLKNVSPRVHKRNIWKKENSYFSI